jgi:hypothetical protein
MSTINMYNETRNLFYVDFAIQKEIFKNISDLKVPYTWRRLSGNINTAQSILLNRVYYSRSCHGSDCLLCK